LVAVGTGSFFDVDITAIRESTFVLRQVTSSAMSFAWHFNLVRLARAAVCLLLATGLCGCVSSYRRGLEYQIDHRYSVGDEQFQRSMGQLMGPGILPGNKITTLVNGDQIFPAMLSAVRGAKKSICLETYIYFSGTVGREFSEALAERALAGVKVHVVMDWLGSRSIDSADMDLMEKSGVEVFRFNPLVWHSPLRVNHRNHRKLLIIDGTVGFIGGAGLADLWEGNADSPEHWRDTHFQVEGPAVGQMQAAFMDNWIKSSARVLDGEEYFPELHPEGDASAQVFYSSPKDGAESVRLMYLLSIAAARSNIRLSASYFVPGSLTTEELVAAAERGVNVEIIVAGAKTDAPLVRYASRGKWGPLLKAGVKIYEYEPTMYHCKVMVVDDVWVSAGSANFDNRSFRLNDEANLNVFSRPFADQQIELFERDKKNSRLVTYHAWRNRGLFKKIVEHLTTPLQGLF
jgi:cardiolipin synthase